MSGTQDRRSRRVEVEESVRDGDTRLGPFERGLLLAAVVALGLALVLPARADGAGPTATVRVHAGDSLWSLARACAGPDGDVRAAATAIRDLNGLEDSRIAEGTVLVLPARESATLASR